MIEGAGGRDPAAGHWDIYRQAEVQHPDLLSQLADTIRNYAAPLREMNSTTAGAEILPTWARRNEWDQLFGGDSSQLFGMVVWAALYDDARIWRTTSEIVAGRQVRIYRRT